MYKDPHLWADCVEWVIWVGKQTHMIHTQPVGGIVGRLHFVRENAASDQIDSIWLVNNHVDLYTYCTVF